MVQDRHEKQVNGMPNKGGYYINPKCIRSFFFPFASFFSLTDFNSSHN